MARKKKTATTKAATLDAPQSRNEALLQNILGANNALGDPQSRNEALLMNILGESYDIGEPQSRIEQLLMQIKEQGTGGKITADDLGKVVQEITAGEYGLVAQTAHAEITENGIYDTTANNSVTVNIQSANRDYLGLSYGFVGAGFFSYTDKITCLNCFHLEAGKTYLISFAVENPFNLDPMPNRYRLAFFPSKSFDDFAEYIENPAPQELIFSASWNSTADGRYDDRYAKSFETDGELIVSTSNERNVIPIYCIEQIESIPAPAQS